MLPRTASAERRPRVPVGKNLSFASVEPTGEDEQQKLEGLEVDHGRVYSERIDVG